MFIRTCLPVLAAIISLQFSAAAQTFDDFLKQLNSANPAGKPALIKSYLSKLAAIPIIESDTTARFLYYGNADSVAVAGDATAWVPGIRLKRIAGCDLWYATACYPSDTRVEYKMVINGTRWILDSLNQLVIQGGMGPNSELLMPAYIRPLFVNEKDVVPWGFYTDTVIQSKYLGEARKIRVYIPPKYEKSDTRYPVAYFHDGFQFFDFTSARNILDNMTFDKLIRPIIAVFVEPVHRDDEYSGRLQNKYTRFMLEELMPFIDKNYRTLPKPQNSAQFGISNGGNIALWIAVRHPERVGMVAAFSSNVQPGVSKAFMKTNCSGSKIYLDLGKYDLPQLIPMVRGLKKILEKKSCPLSYHEYPEGHNWAFWQKHLPDALKYLFPAE